MSLPQDYVTTKLSEQDFNILDMVPEPETGFLVLRMTHNLHPNVEFTVTLITLDSEGNDTMEMRFDGPDDFTDEEAKQVLQEVMDILIHIIEQSIGDQPSLIQPTPTPTPIP
jgi:hypothetical protein